MKIRTLLGLTVIGSAVYAHKRHGGEFSIESIKRSLQDLWTGIRGTASDAKTKAAELADKAEDKMKSVVDSARSGATSAPTTAVRSGSDEPRRYGPNGPVSRGR